MVDGSIETAYTFFTLTLTSILPKIGNFVSVQIDRSTQKLRKRPFVDGYEEEIDPMAKPDDHPNYTISQLAEAFDISTRTIRFYEEKGLLSPARSAGNQRIYSKRDRARLKLILRGKRFGYSLDEIAEMIGMADVDMNEADQIRNALTYGDRKLEEIRSQIEQLNLLEQDLQAVREKLLRRMAEIEAAP